MLRLLACWVAVWLLPCPAIAAAQRYWNLETAPVQALARSADGERLALAHTAAGSVHWFSWQQGRLRQDGSVAVGRDPVSVRFRGNHELWVVAQTAATISVLDLRHGGRVKALINTPQMPADVVFAGRPQRAYLSTLRQPALWVYDPQRLQEPPKRVALAMPEPRALAVSADAMSVYVLSYRSGNASTVLPGSFVDRQQLAYQRNVVGHPQAPHAGRNPIPNAGDEFDPPLASDLPLPPRTGIIVQRQPDGRWVDDNDGDWSAFVSGELAPLTGRVPGWQVPDRDLAIVSTSGHAVDYRSSLLTHGLALALAPDGALLLAGIEAHNRTRFEPQLRGRFASHLLLELDPDSTESEPTRLQLNQADAANWSADQAVAEVRAIAIDPRNGRRYLAAQGSNALLRLNPDGSRPDDALLELPEGPGGLAFGVDPDRLVVWSRFAARLSVLDTGRYATVQELPLEDPTPAAVRAGRPWLYDARRSSASGTLSCSTCHLDARSDRLAWDLGNPAGAMQSFDGHCVTDAGRACPDWHPLKGPMLTLPLSDLIGHEPFHWRGDRAGIHDFAQTYTALLGREQPPTRQQLDQLRDFLASVRTLPNPYRELDERLPTALNLARVSGIGPPLNSSWPSANAVRGLELFRSARLAPPFECVSCHTLPTGYSSTATLFSGGQRTPTLGPHGEARHGLSALAGLGNGSFKVSGLREFFDRVDPSDQVGENWTGLGFGSDGSLLTPADFLRSRGFRITSAQDEADLLALLLAFGGNQMAHPQPGTLREPRGPEGTSTPAALGRTLIASPGQALGTAFDEWHQAALAGIGEVRASVIVDGRELHFRYDPGAEHFTSNGDSALTSEQLQKRHRRDWLRIWIDPPDPARTAEAATDRSTRRQPAQPYKPRALVRN